MEISLKFAGNPLGDDSHSNINEISLSLQSRLTQYIKNSCVTADAKLIPGEHALSLSERPAILIVEDDTRVSIKLDIQSDPHNQLYLNNLLIEFTRPLHLKNIFTTIDELSELVTDFPSLIRPKIDFDVNEIISKNEWLEKASSFVETKAETYIGKISELSAWKFIKETAEKRKLSENLEKSKEISKEWLEKGLEKAEELLDNAFKGVRLSKLEISAVNKDDDLKLVFYVSGEIVVNEKIKRSFEHIQSPDTLLKGIDAHLDCVLCQFYVDKTQGTNISRTIVNMIQELEAKLTAKLDISTLPLSLSNHQGYQFLIGVNIQQLCDLTSTCHVTRNDDLFSFDILTGILDDHLQSGRQIHLTMQSPAESLVSSGQAMIEGGWQVNLLGQGKDIQGTMEIIDELHLKTSSVSINAKNDRLKGHIDADMNLEIVCVKGQIQWGIDASGHAIHIHQAQLNINGNLALTDHQVLNFAQMDTTFTQLQGDFDIQFHREALENIDILAHSDLTFEAHSDIHVQPLPEFELYQPNATVDFMGNIQTELQMKSSNSQDELVVVDLDNSNVHILCDQLQFVRDRLSFRNLSPIEADVRVITAAYSTHGFSNCRIQLEYFCEKSPVLMTCNQSADLLPPSLVAHHNQIECAISNSGVLHFENGEGFYDHHFFNAILTPFKETHKLLTMLENPELGKYLKDIAQLAIFPILPGTEKFFDRLFRWIKRCKEFNIFSVQKLIHIPNLALAISLFFFDNDSAVDEILPSLERINLAEGIDRYKLEELFDRAFPDHDFDNTGRILKWLNKIFTPVSFETPVITHHPALCDDPEYQNEIASLPSANQMYDGDWKDKNLVQKIYRYASGFSVEQLDWIVENHADDLSQEQIIKIKKLAGIKRKILELEPREGTFILQDYNITVFLEDLLNTEQLCLDSIQSDDQNTDSDLTNCFRTWLNPADMARLISAGISSRYHGVFVQINQARLWEIIQKRHRTYALAVFYEVGQHNVRTLAAMLMSYLAQDQSMLACPVDRVTALSELLGINLPRPEEFEPWNHQGSGNFTDAIYKAADIILQSNTLYNAALLRMVSYRHPVTAQTPHSDEVELAYKQFIDTLQSADLKTTQLLKDYLQTESNEIYQTAQKLYQDVLESAKHLLKLQKDAFELSEFKSFWTRLYESLRITSVDDDLIDDNDEVRGWYAYRKGLKIEEILHLPRVKRITDIIELIYIRQEDQEQFKIDPLVWFVPRAAHIPIDLTIITSMGVVTYGKAGYELKTAFERLNRDYQIQVIRSDTGLFKSLDYNAQCIIHVIEQVKSPFVMIGYSQGCANMMRAESLLYAGTPQMRSCLDNLVSRKFLCSAFNGSVHAVCGVAKYRTALIDGEKILKSISLNYSKYLSRLAIRFLQRTLDAPTFNMSMSSFESLSHHGLQQISRDAQYVPGIPELESQGYTKKHIPEALLMMTSHFYKQANTPNDSQVGLDCAHGYPVYNHNESVDVLFQEAIPSKPLDIHHWSPLREEIQIIQTHQDYERYDFRGPKSMFVTPWIESLILLDFAHPKTI